MNCIATKNLPFYQEVILVRMWTLWNVKFSSVFLYGISRHKSIRILHPRWISSLRTPDDREKSSERNFSNWNFAFCVQLFWIKYHLFTPLSAETASISQKLWTLCNISPSAIDFAKSQFLRLIHHRDITPYFYQTVWVLFVYQTLLWCWDTVICNFLTAFDHRAIVIKLFEAYAAGTTPIFQWPPSCFLTVFMLFLMFRRTDFCCNFYHIDEPSLTFYHRCACMYLQRETQPTSWSLYVKYWVLFIWLLLWNFYHLTTNSRFLTFLN